MNAKKCSIFILLLGCLPCMIRGYAPNHFIGTCLTPEWVAETEKNLEIDSQAQDSYGRFEHPFLRPALTEQNRFIEDGRQAVEGVYSPECLDDSSTFYGPKTEVDSGNNALSQEDFRGTVVVEIQAWASHALTSIIYSIIAQEVLGYKVSILTTSTTLEMAERMSSKKTGTCVPTHVNLESWDFSRRSLYAIHEDEVARLGSVGYDGRTGLYTTTAFVELAQDKDAFGSGPYSVDFWRDYKVEDAVINALSMNKFNNTAFYPTSGVYCKDGVMGCLDNCAKTYACTLREDGGDECMVVQLMISSYDPGYYQAVLDNLDVPTYICFIGYGGVISYADHAKRNKQPILFYHYEPDTFHAEHRGEFERIFLPRAKPERVALHTNTFGENGYGQRTNSKVDVDFPSMVLSKYMSRVIRDTKAGALAQAISISELHVNDILQRYFYATTDGNNSDPTFEAACGWIKDNYKTWDSWLDRPVVCTLDEHVKYTMTGCGNSSNERIITFEWKNPYLADPSRPFDCNGGLGSLPDPIRTSHSCEWLEPRYNVWKGWIEQLDYCDHTYYTYTVSDCDEEADRRVEYQWLLPNESDAAKPIDCEIKDITLPESVVIRCEYVPSSSSAFTGVLVVCIVADIILVGLLIAVFIHRNSPIIKRSQYQLLMTMIFGGIMMISGTMQYAGKPTNAICLMRPTLLCFGFTTVFGALIVKSLRVHRVFMKSSLKKQTVSAWNAFMKLFGFLSIDAMIMSVWYGVDPPVPMIYEVKSTEFSGYADVLECSSKNGIFSILLLFWKAVMLFLGLYSSFLIRNVSADFQEAIWIFASSVVVLLGCLVLLPLAYLVQLPATTFFIFFSASILLCTGIVMALMLVPKFMKHTGLVSESRGSASSLTASTSNVRNPTTSSKFNDSTHNESEGRRNTGSKNTGKIFVQATESREY